MSGEYAWTGGCYLHHCSVEELVQPYADGPPNALKEFQRDLRGLPYFTADAEGQSLKIRIEAEKLAQGIMRLGRHWETFQPVIRAMAYWQAGDSSEESFKAALEKWRNGG